MTWVQPVNAKFPFPEGIRPRIQERYCGACSPEAHYGGDFERGGDGSGNAGADPGRSRTDKTLAGWGVVIPAEICYIKLIRQSGWLSNKFCDFLPAGPRFDGREIAAFFEKFVRKLRFPDSPAEFVPKPRGFWNRHFESTTSF
jgi:hypothetical protein